MKAARFLQVRGLVEVGEDQLKEQNARLAIKNKSKEVPKKRVIAPKRKPDFVVSDYDTDDSVISCFYSGSWEGGAGGGHIGQFCLKI